MIAITMRLLCKGFFACVVFCLPISRAAADSDVYLLDVPDYQWFAGCFGTGCGNLAGYWDRHGMNDFYTGPTGGGVAPLNDRGANIGIRSMWASKAGMDGRPANQPGHIDDYWIRYASDGDFSYQSTVADPYVTAGRAEHAPDCIGDFIGLSQKKWTNMNNECDGNIDAFSFVYWDTNGNRRLNFTPTAATGPPPRDIQSGLRQWAKYRGYDADVFTQLTDFNPNVPPGAGFTFEELKSEINAGYPVLVFLQNYVEKYRGITNTVPMARANPEIHGMLIYGYKEYPDFGVNYVYCRTSWGIGDGITYSWGPDPWLSDPGEGLALYPRGVIGFHPRPRIRSIQRSGNELTITWDGPSSQVRDVIANTTTPVHRYQIEKTASLTPPSWERVGSPTTDRTITITDLSGDAAFYRVAPPGE